LRVRRNWSGSRNANSARLSRVIGGACHVATTYAPRPSAPPQPGEHRLWTFSRRYRDDEAPNHTFTSTSQGHRLRAAPSSVSPRCAAARTPGGLADSSPLALCRGSRMLLLFFCLFSEVFFSEAAFSGGACAEAVCLGPALSGAVCSPAASGRCRCRSTFPSAVRPGPASSRLRWSSILAIWSCSYFNLVPVHDR